MSEEQNTFRQSLVEAIKLLIESQDSIGGDWRTRRDDFLVKIRKITNV